MSQWVDTIIVLVILTNLMLLGASRFTACIRMVALQGILLGLLPLLSHWDNLTVRVVIQAAASMTTKGVIFPWLLIRAFREADIRRENSPIIGFTTSLFVGVLLLALATWFGGKLPLPWAAPSSFMVPTAMFTIMIGLFVIVSRRKAIMQVLGYLAMENGIYTFGLSFAQKEPLLVEMGILLDVLAAVLVMGITIYHINRQFDHMDTDKMTVLKD